MPVELTDNKFNSEVLEAEGVVLVDFWAPWCGPCRMVGPIVDKLAQTYAGKAKIAKLNVDENPYTASQFQIMSIPTMMIFKDGELVDQWVGAMPEQAIVERLERQLSVTA
ncbi:MAG: thioredoxin [Firmicutes bacterium]|mgnify:FL=1|nr:thioredoxin [Bacillota bacterium]